MYRKDVGGDSMCFGCSPNNPIGLQLTFTSDGEFCRTNFTAQKQHQGWDGHMHGGLITTLLDETMAWWLWDKQIAVMTAELTTRFSLGVPIAANLLIESWCTQQKKDRLFLMEAHIVMPDGTIPVTAKGKFLKVDSKLLAP